MIRKVVLATTQNKINQCEVFKWLKLKIKYN